MTFSALDIAVLTQTGLATLRNKNGLFSKIARNFSTQTGNIVLVPSFTADSASLWSTSTGYGPSAVTMTGTPITMKEPYKLTYELTPLQSQQVDFNTVANIAFPNQIGALVQECYKQYYSNINATTVPVQFSASAASYDLVNSGSQVIFTSGSSSPQFALAGQKFDLQLKSNLIALNYLAGAQAIAGNTRDGYAAGAVDVVPSYDLVSNATGADAVVLMPDTIIAGSRLPDVNGDGTAQVFDIQDPMTGFAIRSFVWFHPVNKTWQLSSTVQFTAVPGRTGFGARLKIN